MWNRVDLKARGKEAFRKNYWASVAVALLSGWSQQYRQAAEEMRWIQEAVHQDMRIIMGEICLAPCLQEF